jgi:hypothetical protein
MRLRSCIPIAIATAVAVAIPVSALPSGGSVRIRPTPSGFDATARVSSDGAVIRIGGPARCTKGGRLRIDVTLTQRASGAVGRGTWKGRCRGSVQHWTVSSARALTGRFVAGQATACAAAAAANSKRATDAVQWCRVVTLRS